MEEVSLPPCDSWNGSRLWHGVPCSWFHGESPAVLEERAGAELETGDEHPRLECCEKTSLVLAWANFFSTFCMLLLSFRDEPFAESPVNASFPERWHCPVVNLSFFCILFIEDNKKRELTVYISAVQGLNQFCPAEVHGLKITCAHSTCCSLSC